MAYLDLRDQIKDGDVLAYQYVNGWFKTWYSFKVNLVRLVTRSEYSHVGMAVLVEGRVMLLDSVTPVVRLIPLSNDLPCYHLTGHGMSEGQRAKGFALIGKAKYSQWDAVLAFFSRNSAGDDRWSCAEFVTYVLDLPCQATPSRVVEHMLATGSTLRELS